VSGKLNLSDMPEPFTEKQSERLPVEEIATALAAPTERSAPRHSCGCRTPSRQSGALAVNETSGASQRTSLADVSEATPEIALDQLCVNDQIIIQTVRSTYIILVIDPVKRLGRVVGGIFGDSAAEVFLESMPVALDHRLRAGARACFYIESGVRNKRVVTSVITNLIHQRAG